MSISEDGVSDFQLNRLFVSKTGNRMYLESENEFAVSWLLKALVDMDVTGSLLKDMKKSVSSS